MFNCNYWYFNFKKKSILCTTLYVRGRSQHWRDFIISYGTESIECHMKFADPMVAISPRSLILEIMSDRQPIRFSYVFNIVKHENFTNVIDDCTCTALINRETRNGSPTSNHFEFWEQKFSKWPANSYPRRQGWEEGFVDFLRTYKCWNKI